MVSDHADESQWFRQFMDVQNMVFFIELCLEVLLYLIAHGVVGVLTGEWHFFVITSHRRVQHLLGSDRCTIFPAPIFQGISLNPKP